MTTKVSLRHATPNYMMAIAVSALVPGQPVESAVPIGQLDPNGPPFTDYLHSGRSLLLTEVALPQGHKLRPSDKRAQGLYETGCAAFFSSAADAYAKYRDAVGSVVLSVKPQPLYEELAPSEHAGWEAVVRPTPWDELPEADKNRWRQLAAA